jgi:protease-4
MKQLLRTIEKVSLKPWVITPAGYAAVKQLIDSKLAGGAQVDVSRQDFQGAETGYTIDRKSIAQITISGTLGQRLSWLEKICGGVDYLDVAATIQEALDDGADGIQFIFDSPGGMAIGCAECAQVIADVPVPTVGFCDSLMCSGAYWLASGCDYLVATSSADVGSIGVIIPWADQTKLWDQMGLKWDPIVSDDSSLKTTMYGPALTEEQKAYLQGEVNQTAKAFTDHVSSFRELDFTQLKAGSYSGDRALEFNLIDKIGTLNDAYNELLARIQKKAAVDTP